MKNNTPENDLSEYHTYFTEAAKGGVERQNGLIGFIESIHHNVLQDFFVLSVETKRFLEDPLKLVEGSVNGFLQHVHYRRDFGKPVYLNFFGNLKTFVENPKFERIYWFKFYVHNSDSKVISGMNHQFESYSITERTTQDSKEGL